MTDGTVHSPEAVIEQSRLFRNEIRVFSFGLGSQADKSLVQKTAKAGRGIATLVADGANDLSGQVVRVLQMAMEPSLCDTIYGFNGKLKEADEVFRNHLITDTVLIDAEQLNDVKFNFSTNEAESDKSLNLEFGLDRFKKIEGPAATALFKMAAYHKIEETEENEEKVKISVKHQVVCDETAIVGVLK